ncbi:MAG: hypothetical protein ABIS03_01435 [Gemmatimonadaceae bacterium]
MKLSKIVAGLVVLALPLSGALAQRDDQFAVGIGGGVVVPAGLASDHHKLGPQGTLSLGIGMVDSPFGIRFDGMYAGLPDRGGSVAGVDQGSARLFVLTANGVFNIYGSNTRLYAVTGIGGHWYTPDGTGASSRNDFALQTGLGIWLPFANVFLEAKWMNLYRMLPDRETGLSGKRSGQLYPITLGIIF